MTEYIDMLFRAAFAKRQAELALQQLEQTAPRDDCERNMFDLFAKGHLVLLNDGPGWNHQVYRAAVAIRNNESDAGETVARLVAQAPYRSNNEIGLLQMALANELLPPISKGRPYGAINRSVEALAAAEEFFDLSGTNPADPPRQKPRGMKGGEAATKIGTKLNVAGRTVQEWVRAYRAGVAILNGQGRDGRAILRAAVKLNRRR